MNKPETTGNPGVPGHFRRLKSNELVCAGDFVANEGKAFELWEGPNGFQADSFVKAIYRKKECHSATTKKLD